MSNTKKLGIWMDHSSAHLIEFSAEPEPIRIIHSKFDHQTKELAMHQGESHMHTKEQHEQTEYYRALGQVIRNYAAVLLFGPTDAKTELFNLLQKDHHFTSITIDVLPADKMSDIHQRIFVNKHFAQR